MVAPVERDVEAEEVEEAAARGLLESEDECDEASPGMKEAKEFVEELEEEAAAIRPQRRCHPRPSAQELRDHERTHLPYRTWCAACVAGRGLNTRHSTDKGDKKIALPMVAMDYCFLRNDVGGDYASVLVSKDRDTRMICAHIVPAKGGTPSGWRPNASEIWSALDIEVVWYYGGTRSLL